MCVLLNFMQSPTLKLDEILAKCTIMEGWINNVWIEAVAFIGVGKVHSNRDQPEIEADSNRNRILRASPCCLNDHILSKSSKCG